MRPWKGPEHLHRRTSQARNQAKRPERANRAQHPTPIQKIRQAKPPLRKGHRAKNSREATPEQHPGSQVVARAKRRDRLVQSPVGCQEKLRVRRDSSRVTHRVVALLEATRVATRRGRAVDGVLPTGMYDVFSMTEIGVVTCPMRLRSCPAIRKHGPPWSRWVWTSGVFSGSMTITNASPT